MSQRRYSPIPIPIEDGQTEENIKSHKGIMFKRARVLNKETTTDNYADSLAFDARLLKNKLFHIKEINGTNAIKYKILACIDPSMWYELLSETQINAGLEDTQFDDGAWAYYKLQVKSAAAGNAGKATAFISGQTP